MKIEIYRARDGWRWRLKARNGRIVAESGEAYQRRSACRRMCAKLFYDARSILAHLASY